MGVFSDIIAYGYCDALLNRLFKQRVVPPTWYRSVKESIVGRGKRLGILVLVKKGFERSPRVPVVFIYKSGAEWFLEAPEEVLVIERPLNERLVTALSDSGLAVAIVNDFPLSNVSVETLTKLLDKHLKKGRR